MTVMNALKMRFASILLKDLPIVSPPDGLASLTQICPLLSPVYRFAAAEEVFQRVCDGF
jgi:hypothetical protein